MSLFSGILQAQAPAKQDATSAIHTLCLRLTSSSLVEDRRAAVLSLRSFAREYKELVASGGLRGLIGTLAKDSEDVDTAKVVLETLRMLFVKDEMNPESSHDIALWLADEFTQKQENLSILIDLLESPDFYTRLYTLQLLRDILENRPERTQECIFAAPLGITRLVSILDDQRDAIRNEVILLLISLTDGHRDVQKLVAFESAFERVFNIIDIEGGIDGGIVAQDCLQLLNNLLTHNASNQTLFRETGFVPKLYKVFDVEGDLLPFAMEKRNVNLIMTLRVCRAFVAPGGHGTPANQQVFFNSGILGQVLNLAFSGASEFDVRADALRTCADMIHANAPLQESFAQLQVSYLNPSVPIDPQAPKNGETSVYVIEGLLDQALRNALIQAFDLRIAACSCLESYFSGNSPIKLHFLRRAIDGYTSGEESAANILTCLMEMDNESRNDPYRIWVAAVIFLHLISDHDEAKEMATSVVVGDEEEGEEVVTAIQTIAGNLITSLEHNYDPRISLAYLMVLCAWMYEDTTAVDDFLQEGATVQTLVAAVTQSTNANSLVQGLCVFLLGILYEFSTTESPVPRATLHTILVSRLGRDQYVNKLTRLRENPMVRDFEATAQTYHGKRGLPDLFFDHVFIDFLKDNYSRIFRAIDKDPGQKTHYKLGSDGTPNGISLELVDSLKAQIEDKDASINKLQASIMSLEKELAQEQQDFKRFKETSASEIRKLHEQAEAMKNHLEASATAADKHFRATVLQLENRVARVQQEGEGKIKQLEGHIAQAKKEGEENLKRQKAHHDLELKRAKHVAEQEATKARQEAEKEMKRMDDEYRKELARIHSEAQATVQRVITDSRRDVERVKADNEDRLKELREKTDAEVKQAREQVTVEINSAREQSNAVIKMLEDRINELETDLESAAKDHTTELESARKQHAIEREAAVQEVKTRMEKEAEEKVRKAKEEAEERYKQLEKDMEEKLKKAQEEADAKVKAAEEKAIKSAEEKMKKEWEEKLNAAQEKAKNTQSELDDLLMVIGDIEDKKKNYKARLKALGETVSEDEGEDDDDDDDDDEEEGEEEEEEEEEEEGKE